MKDAKSIGGYARALFELAQESGDSAEYHEKLQQVAAAVTPELLALAENPSFHSDEKRQVLAELARRFGLDKTLSAFLVLLAEQRRLRNLPEISRQYRSLLFVSQNKRLVEITSARPLKSQQTKQIESAVARLVPGKLEFEMRVDPDLLGGVVVKVGSRVFDGSVRGRLNQLRAELMSA